MVEPPANPGNPNGGQGGDGMIGRDVTMQFTAGWDWIQPVRDRNTGIWDAGNHRGYRGSRHTRYVRQNPCPRRQTARANCRSLPLSHFQLK
ncbi:MAG: hypothetical protein MZV63_34925 [Marinilabiliales bacterium]|nr:hypothetical protein [Marinilabiliales bacterium]